MKQETLRELERLWRESQTVEAETAYLKARYRTGEISEKMLMLAAYCGHIPSESALGDECFIPKDDPNGWTFDLIRFGRHIKFFAGVIAASLVLPYFEQRSHLRHPRIAVEHAIKVFEGKAPPQSSLTRHCADAAVASTYDLEGEGYSEALDAAATTSFAVEGNACTAVSRAASIIDWEAVLRPALSDVFINYALHDWRDFASLLPPEQGE